MAKLDPAVLAHLEWIGFVQPIGLVVSAPALVRAGAILDRSDAEGQRLLRDSIVERTLDGKEDLVPSIPDFKTFARKVLGWSFSPKGYGGTEDSPITDALEIAVDGGTLRPDFAVRELEPQNNRSPWQLLVRVLEPGEDFDRVSRGKGQIEASEHGRMERLLRQTGVAAGLIFNGRAIRLLSAPYGETSGWLDFKVADMVQTAGRPITTAMRLLLSEQRLLSLPRVHRLAALLDDSRKFQNEVSERLAEQVLHALYELLRGFQHANDQSKGELLRYTLNDHPDMVYRGLLTTLLRLVFLLYAEERDMLPEDETYLRYYSLAGLYERLREDAALYPDTMEQRYGAWGQLLALFRMIHDGAEAGAMRLPKRHGVLFDPDSYPFLEGRFGGARQIHERIEPPLVPDATVWRALEKLLILDGERISYRALDVEQIGSVYETMMGFRLERTTGPSVAIKAQKKQGAPTAIDLEALLGEPAEKRDKWIADRADRKLTDTVKKAVKDAKTEGDLHAALAPVVDRYATPDLIPAGSMVLQPSEERRRSGSHYTPRTLTEPIVRTTLQPILEGLHGEDGSPPKPEQILDLKICDPAMGSGAFLVETCRQLGAALVQSWRDYEAIPQIPFDENEEIFARRLVAQRCLYGVDKNPVAVDLAKVSLWLFTLAREHPLTFIDHALRHGDSLVGLSRKQIEAFHWDESAPAFQKGFEAMRLRDHLERVTESRRQIREADESITEGELRDLWHEAQIELKQVRLFGDLVVAAFLGTEDAPTREMKRNEYAGAVADGVACRYTELLASLRVTDRPLVPFHWEIEFPEVFTRDNPGFDCVIGNPPFAGGKLLSGYFGPAYPEFLKAVRPDTVGAADLVAYFFRRGYELLRQQGALGFLSTNSIAQTATRAVGLDPLVKTDAVIFAAQREVQWPGEASVVVSRIHLSKGRITAHFELDGRRVGGISSSLHATIDVSKAVPLAPDLRYSTGVFLFGDSFVMRSSRAVELRRNNPGLQGYLRVYVNGDVLNGTSTVEGDLLAADFGERDEGEIRGCAAFLSELKASVALERSAQTRQIHEHRPWLLWDKRTEFFAEARRLPRIIAGATPCAHVAFRFVSPEKLLTHSLVLIADDSDQALAILQSRVHESWARATCSSLGNALRYTTTTALKKFPLPRDWRLSLELENVGRRYDMLREVMMVSNEIGLTEVYNRFNDPERSDDQVVRLREYHIELDRAVLACYGWSDLHLSCEFVRDRPDAGSDERSSRRGNPHRYRWPDEIRDEVLARLLELNAQRAAEEARSGAPAQKPRRVKQVKLAQPESAEADAENGRHAQERTFKRIVLSAEIIHQLHDEPTFGRVKHQKIVHLCEYIARLPEIEGEYFRQAAGPLDNKLIKMTEKKLRELKWYETVERDVIGHAYRPLPKAGDHEKYLERYWPDKLTIIRRLIEKMRKWDTQTCEIFSTVYAVWNDMVITGLHVTDDAILNEILQNWHESKQRIPAERWHRAIAWIREQGYTPTGFGRPTSISPKKTPPKTKRTRETGGLF